MDGIHKSRALAVLTLMYVISTLSMSVHAALQENPYVDVRGFSINPPSGWTIEQLANVPGMAVVFLGPIESNVQVQMSVSINTTSLGLTDYVAAIKSRNASNPNFTNYTIVMEGPTIIGGLGAYQIVATFSQGGFNLEHMEVVFVENRNAYLVYSLAPKTVYDAYSPVFTESAQTFKITGTEFPWVLIILGGVTGAGVVISLVVVFRRRKHQITPADHSEDPV